jgi:hypothetical protein
MVWHTVVTGVLKSQTRFRYGISGISFFTGHIDDDVPASTDDSVHKRVENGNPANPPTTRTGRRVDETDATTKYSDREV